MRIHPYLSGETSPIAQVNYSCCRNIPFPHPQVPSHFLRREFQRTASAESTAGAVSTRGSTNFGKLMNKFQSQIRVMGDKKHLTEMLIGVMTCDQLLLPSDGWLFGL
ncbi:hypothetical protein J6590_043559 [Homalodisca vitripennis]|nr:hypothetical protein J6590_043559 [Homalodisca vitripennis]